jgi:translation initiation factor 3 subunit C
MKEEEVKTPIKETKKSVTKGAQSPVTPTAAEGEDDGFTAVGKGGKTVAPVSPANLLTRLREVLESRGKKVMI